MVAALRTAWSPRWTLGGLLAALVWGGCSVEKHYDLLSTLFDGVPVPASDTGADGRMSGTGFGVAGGPASQHSAYIDRRCAECHGDRSKFGFTTEGYSGLDDTTCLKCHADAVEHPVLHGPLGLPACLICHEPHVSLYPKLLVEASPPLCLHCHATEMETTTTPEHADLERDCLECHHPHGGTEQYMLRPPPGESPPPPDPADGAPG